MLLKPDTHLAILERRAAAGSVDIPAADFSMLQSEFTAFSNWMNSWSSSTESMQQLNQELQNHNGFVNAWLQFAMSGSAAPALPPTVPVSRRTDSGSVEISQAQLNLLQSETTTFISWMGASTNSSMANTDAIKSQIKIEFQAYQGWVTAWLAAATSSGASASAAPSNPAPSVSAATPGTGSESPSSASAPSPTSTPLPSPSSTPAAPSMAPSVAPSIAPLAPAVGPSAAAPAATPSSAPSSGGSFNAKAKDNVAVYYGQSPATSQVTLAKMCSDDSVNIIILAFLSEFFSAGGLPTMDFGPACGGQSPQMEAKGATGMLLCGQMATDIATCQSSGKKVLLSLGGATAQTAFTGDDQATAFASTLWNLFGAGTGLDAGLRPFGNTTIDGFDVDNEDKDQTGYVTFVQALRTQFATDKSKQYYISAAPQCPLPDASIPVGAMELMDFVWVQFYNNGICNIGQSGFVDSFTAWSKNIAGGPQLYIGAPACQACAGTGYLAPDAVTTAIKSATAANVPNMGGVMLWDGSEGMTNTAGGQNYNQVVKAALG
ncbi:MAG: hypothetical protein ASARMPREDX12_008338 [Alectoria sarmentosa]|nr:MAG: hypothetical protein ASARMPREDX12_008338 [Alectoria sarmentosa]